MAIANLHTFAWAAASLDLTSTGAYNLSKILSIGNDSVNGSSSLGDQLLGIVGGYGSATGAAGTLWLHLVDNSAATHKVVATFPCALTAQARRTNLANGATDGYTINAVWDESGDRWIDLAGMAQKYKAVTAATGSSAATGGTIGTEVDASNKLEWYIAMQSVGGLGTVTLFIGTTRTI